MKVSIVTILDNTNFGTYLQALATCKAIEDLGHDVEVIRYTRPFMTGWGQFWKLLHDRGILSLLRNGRKIPRTLKLRNQDYTFLSKYVHVTKEYVGFESLQAAPPQSDVYVVGSDQVWNSVYNRGLDKSFYLEFAPQGMKRVAFSSSIGMDDFPKGELSETVKLLRKFSCITVREKTAKEILAQQGIPSEVVLDPTLLLDAKKWSDISEKCDICFSEKYLLIYSVEQKKQDQLIDYYARIIAKQRNLKIYQVSYSGTAKRLGCADEFFGHATPDVFLSLMKNASFVVVSSFHGTAFSINFNKEFLTISANRFNSRVKNLLDLTNLGDRMISDNRYDIQMMKNIDYKNVNIRIEEARERSIFILNDMLKK